MLQLPAVREPAGPVETITVFTIGDTEYAMPKTVDASVGARYLLDVRRYGQAEAGARLFIAALGEPALEALAGYKGLTPSEFNEVVEYVVTYVMGQLEQSSGN